MRNHRWTGLLVIAALGSAMSACGGPAGSASAGPPAVSCSNYAIHAHGKYDNEVSVRVTVSNATTRAVQYAINVEMTASHPRHAAARLTEVTINGSAAAHASVELGHKLLTSDPVRHCRITRVSRS